QSGTPNRGKRLAAIACAGAVVLLAAVRLISYLFDWDGGPDQLLFRDQLDLQAVRVGHPNRMAPTTALAFLLIGLAPLLLDRRARSGLRPAQLLALAAAAVALLAIVGYSYSAVALAGVEHFIPMALNTALTLVVLSAGILAARPDQGLMAVV